MPEPGARLFLALVPADAPGHPVLASVASPSFFLIGELLLGNLSETVVVQGNPAHNKSVLPRGSSDRQPCEFPLHESANAQGPRNELSASHHITSISGRDVQAI